MKSLAFVSENLALGLRLCRQWMLVCTLSWGLYWGLFSVLLPLRVPALEGLSAAAWGQSLSAAGLVVMFGVICWLIERRSSFKSTRVPPPLASTDDPASRLRHIRQGGRLAWSLFIVMTLQYGLSGGWLGFALTPVAALGLAFYLGLNRLAVRLGLAYALVMIVGIQLGWPTLLPFSDQNFTMLPVFQAAPLFAMLVVFSLMPTLALFLQFGSTIALYVRATVEQTVRLLAMAATDALTGLANRGLFNKRLMSEFARARRYQQPFCLAMVDIDHFKRLNDQYGHLAGDAILKELGQLLSHSVRESDLPARYGGEEFALILPQTQLHDAHDLLERIRQVVARKVFCAQTSAPLQMTVSVGVAQVDFRSGSATDIIAAADAALYQAKRSGRNRVMLAPVLPGNAVSAVAAAGIKPVTSKAASVLPPVL